MNVPEHLLDCLMEECAEVIKETSKALRFGLEDRNVLDPTGPTNRERIVTELNDLMGVIHLCVAGEIIPSHWQNSKAQTEKITRVCKFMEHARGVRALEPSSKPDEQPQPQTINPERK